MASAGSIARGRGACRGSRPNAQPTRDLKFEFPPTAVPGTTFLSSFASGRRHMRWHASQTLRWLHLSLPQEVCPRDPCDTKALDRRATGCRVRHRAGRRTHLGTRPQLRMDVPRSCVLLRRAPGGSRHTHLGWVRPTLAGIRVAIGQTWLAIGEAWIEVDQRWTGPIVICAKRTGSGWTSTECRYGAAHLGLNSITLVERGSSTSHRRL